MSLRLLRIAIVLLVSLISHVSIYGQIKDSIETGGIFGYLKDSSHNYFLQAATVSVYQDAHDELLAYTLTNSLGEFRIKGLPLGIKLKVKASFIGYEVYSSTFLISSGEKYINIGTIIMNRGENLLEEVSVTSSPVRMHGDTLEFNAAAFKLDKNAVAEDLLKKLPGIIVWGDGTVTVNGRKINKLLVDGKPFFGGESKVATQNIPKTAIDKVQVYQEAIDLNNPYDSITSINFKLKKGYKSGYFGLFSAGQGSDEKYELGANNNVFTPRTQFAIVGQSNNTNKMGNDINTLLRNNTYKGRGVRVEYQPDFDLKGVNNQTSGGLLFLHDFIPDFNEYRQNRFSTNSFFNHNYNSTAQQIETVNSVGIDSTLQQNTASNDREDVTGFSLSTNYNKRKEEDSLTFSGIYNYKEIEKQNFLQNETFNSQSNILSTSKQYDSSNNIAQNVSFSINYNHHGFYNSTVNKLTNWNIFYSISSENNNLNRILKTNFINNINTGMSAYYNRRYNNNDNRVIQQFSTKLGNFSSWLFGNNRTLSLFNIQFENDLRWVIEKQNNLINDGDTLNTHYFQNNYLSKISKYVILNNIGGFLIRRSFSNILANRYQKDFVISVNAKAQFFSQNNISSQPFQNFSHTYSSFIPSVNLTYYNFQYGEYVNWYYLNFGISNIYPTQDQQFQLVDSSELYYMKGGNIMLKPSKKYELIVGYKHDTYGSKNALNYGASLIAGAIRDYFGDSTRIDNAGRYIHFTTNLSGYKYMERSTFLNKAFPLGAHQLQVNFRTSVGKSRNPGIIGYQGNINSALNISDIFTQSDTLSLYYTYKDLFAINIAEYVTYYKSSQSGFTNGIFENTQTSTRIGIGVNVTKEFSLNTNISYNRFANSNTLGNTYYIWNAFTSYRFLSAKNLEIKFSAMDLLNQNKGIINFGNNYSYTHGTINLLHQYFMMTVSYFPRKFGKNSKAKE